jgi:hypothetical protein
MLAIVGTVPDAALPVLTGTVMLDGTTITVAGHRFPVNRGTPALLAAAAVTSRALGRPAPLAYLVGDIGRGDGSRRLYAHLAEHLGTADHRIMVFHYLQPDVDWHGRVLLALQQMAHMPLLIADAGFMYVAKMSGQAEAYDLFTPDIGELAFLADEKAPHPFYTRGFILHMEERAEEMIDMAYRHGNGAQHLLVKGRQDYVVERGSIRAIVDTPSVPELEPIGGTGDTVTGIAAALIQYGLPIPAAAEAAARINRIAGRLAQPNPATQVTDIIACIERAVDEIDLSASTTNSG